jgi:hypothetical protein
MVQNVTNLWAAYLLSQLAAAQRHLQIIISVANAQKSMFVSIT